MLLQGSNNLLLGVSLFWHVESSPLLLEDLNRLGFLQFTSVQVWVLGQEERERKMPKSKHSEAAMITALQQLDAGRETADVAREGCRSFK